MPFLNDIEYEIEGEVLVILNSDEFYSLPNVSSIFGKNIIIDWSLKATNDENFDILLAVKYLISVYELKD